MRVLLDTNVIISLEDNVSVEAHVSRLVALASGKHELLVHPAASADVSRDKDEGRAQITRTKLSKYRAIEKPPVPPDDFLRRMAPSSRPNDIVDAHLLWALQRNAAEILVTHDIGLARRARELSLADRVYAPAEAVAFLMALEAPEPQRHTAIEGVPVYSIDHSDPFFDSLRADYDDFDGWLGRSARSGRRCYVLRQEGSIEAIMVYKEEAASELQGVPPNVLKIATLKVSEKVRGQKVGELFLKLAFRMAFDKGLHGVYVTVYPKYAELCALFEAFGMRKVGTKGDARGAAEDVYYKPVEPPDQASAISPMDILQIYYPCFVDSSRVRKFFVPIRPAFHDRLFPEVKGRQMRLADWSDLITEGNTIKKAYLSRSSIGSLGPGDLLLFYRSEDTRAITSMGVVEGAIRCKTPEEVLALVGKRTVYTEAEIRGLCAEGEVLVILFWHVSDFRRPAQFKRMQDLGVVRGSIQSIQEVPHESYLILKEVMEVDKRATVD